MCTTALATVAATQTGQIVTKIPCLEGISVKMIGKKRNMRANSQTCRTESEGFSTVLTQADTESTGNQTPRSAYTEPLATLYSRRYNTYEAVLLRLDLVVKQHQNVLENWEKSAEVLQKQRELALAEAKTRYETALCELKNAYESCVCTVELAVSDKKVVIRDKADQIRYKLTYLVDICETARLRMRAESKSAFVSHYSDHISELKEAISAYQMAEIQPPSDLPTVTCPQLRVEIGDLRPKRAENRARDTAGRKGRQEPGLQLREEFEQKRKAILRCSMPLLITPDSSFSEGRDRRSAKLPIYTAR